MPIKKLSLWKTPTAQTKLEEIYRYSLKKWGKNTATKYLTELEKVMEAVASGTKHTIINPDFSTRFPYCTVNRHHIFFEYKEDKLIIVTIFHVVMNVEERMEEEMLSIKKETHKL